QIELVDDFILLKSIGGTSAATLSGRFTIASEQVQHDAKELAKAEEVYNPDILFFDIAYQSERNIDNVNRRCQIYDYEMPIIGWSESEKMIDLNDVYVTLKGDERSEEHTSELQSRENLVCRLLLEKKKKTT